MSEFENRAGSGLDKRVLEVESVERNQAGEIAKIYVKVSRNDTASTPGTQLNAESLKTIIESMIDEAIKKNSSLEENTEVVEPDEEEVVEEETVVTDFTPKTFSTSWTQEQGNLRSSNLTIGSSDLSALYVVVENEDSASINVVVNTNSASSVRLTVSETSGLNSLVGYTTPVFTFYVHVYLDSDRSVKLGTLTGTVTYHFSSVTPDD